MRCHNGKENPIGIETHLRILLRVLKLNRHNGKENPIGIETEDGERQLNIRSLVTTEKKTR